MIRRLAVPFVALLVAACAASAASTSPTSAPATAAPTVAAPPTQGPVSLTIFAAASLKGALETAKAAYEAGFPGSTITLSLDSSSALETQIEQGAPADLFLSADTTNPKKLVDGGFAAGTAVSFAGNELTIIVPQDNPAGLASPFDLVKAGVKVVAAGDAVPITKYAAQLVTNLAAAEGAPADFAAGYAANVVSKEENVKAVVAKIELGEGDAAIVYVTDATASGKVATIGIAPQSANVLATYAGVVVKASANATAAQAFLDWLTGPIGQAIFRQYGFLPPSA